MRKAQAAMEYLMTYGWAILIIIVVVGALWKMGVFKTGATVPCTGFGTQFVCQDYADGTLVLTNGAREISITSVGGGSIDNTTSDCDLNATCVSGKKVVISSILPTGDVDIAIIYTVIESGLSHTETGAIHN